jgi:hypothetical protein
MMVCGFPIQAVSIVVTNSLLDYGEAMRIVENLGHLPLAIDQAGAYLNRLSKPLHAFLPLFEANFKTVLSKKPPTAVWQYGEKTVVTTWEISFEAIQAEDPQAASLLLLCSFLNNEDIDTDFLSRGASEVLMDGELDNAALTTCHQLTASKDHRLATILEPCFRFPLPLKSSAATASPSTLSFIHGPGRDSHWIRAGR